MQLPKWCPVFGLIVSVFLPRAGDAQTVFTEDFETPDIANYFTYPAGQSMVTATNTWAITQNSVDLYEAPARAEANAYDGTQAVDLTGSPGAGIMEAAFSTVPGKEYKLIFHYARNHFVDPDTARAMVSVIGTVPRYQGTFFHDPVQTFGTYLEYQANFTADTTESVLRFASLTDGVAGITVDGISIAATSPVGVTPRPVTGDGDRLLLSHPNPFRGTVAIEYELAASGFVRVVIHDVQGRVVRTLVGMEQAAGPHAAAWTGAGENGDPVPSGIYFAVLKTPRRTVSQRLLLIR